MTAFRTLESRLGDCGAEFGSGVGFGVGVGSESEGGRAEGDVVLLLEVRVGMACEDGVEVEVEAGEGCDDGDDDDGDDGDDEMDDTDAEKVDDADDEVDGGADGDDGAPFDGALGDDGDDDDGGPADGGDDEDGTGLASVDEVIADVTSEYVPSASRASNSRCACKPALAVLIGSTTTFPPMTVSLSSPSPLPIPTSSSNSGTSSSSSKVHLPNFPSLNILNKCACANPSFTSPPFFNAPNRFARAVRREEMSFVGSVNSGGRGRRER